MNRYLKLFHLLIVVLISLSTVYRLFQPGLFSMQDDMHVFRLQQFDKCLNDGQIPCRYIPDGGLGYGYPLFNYYSPLPYVMGELFHQIGFTFIDSIKLVFILSQLLAGLGIYFLASHLFGNAAGLASSSIYLLAPYRAVNIFVRGALAETLALSLVPLVFYFFLKYISDNQKKYFYFSTLSLSALILSHNLSVIVFIPLLIIFLFSRQSFKFKQLFSLIPIFIFSLTQTAFFILPAIFEKNLVTVHTMTQAYFNYINHFVTLKQLFIDRFWGYGASLWGPVDDMSFQVGYLHWLLPIAAFIYTLKSYLKTKKINIFTGFLFVCFLFFLFLTHNKSTFIWQALPFMAYFQFPWRFLGPAIFMSSLLAGYFIKSTPKKYIGVSLVFIIVITFILNINFFREDIWYSSLTDQEKLSGSNLIAQSGAGLKDYWPSGTNSYPQAYAPHQAYFMNSSNQVNFYTKNSHQAEAQVIVSSSDILTFPIVYYPNWKLTINNLNSDFQIDPELGLIKLPLNPGTYQINLNFTNTPIRTIANIISLMGFIIFPLYPFLFNKRHD